MVALIGAAALGACSPLRVFDTLVPKDQDARLVVRGAAYGPDPRQRLDIYAPSRAAPRPWPVIVFIYGGSWNSGFREGYGFVGRALAAHGFLVVIPDYRLVPQIRYPVFLEDNAAAVRWTIAHAGQYDGDPRRLVIAGHSAGAYDAAMLAYDPRWLGAERAALRGFVGLAGPYDFLPSNVPAAIAAFGANPDPHGMQPLDAVSPGAPPALLATGDRDKTVGPYNSDRLAERLRAAGVMVERRTYPAVGHIGLVTALAAPFRKRAPVLADVVGFAGMVTR
ncbi:MAG: alpha/beta hydrolase [Sphingomonadales bacterium]|nr:alpha/beta hydrolase [Sphingomonadales bacterium]